MNFEFIQNVKIERLNFNFEKISFVKKYYKLLRNEKNAYIDNRSVFHELSLTKLLKNVTFIQITDWFIINGEICCRSMLEIQVRQLFRWYNEEIHLDNIEFEIYRDCYQMLFRRSMEYE